MNIIFTPKMIDKVDFSGRHSELLKMEDFENKYVPCLERRWEQKGPACHCDSNQY